MRDKKTILNDVEFYLTSLYHTTPAKATPDQLHSAISRTLMAEIAGDWQKSTEAHRNTRHAY